MQKITVEKLKSIYKECWTKSYWTVAVLYQIVQSPVVQKANNAIQRVNHYLGDKCYRFQNGLSHPPDRNLISWWLHPPSNYQSHLCCCCQSKQWSQKCLFLEICLRAPALVRTLMNWWQSLDQNCLLCHRKQVRCSAAISQATSNQGPRKIKHFVNGKKGQLIL